MTKLRKSNKFEKPALYEVLEAMYDNNGLYDAERRGAIVDSTFLEALKPLRTVVNRSTEFFVAKIHPTTNLVFSTDNAEIVEPINQVSRWSNFAGKKQLFLRNLALYGDLFLKVYVDNTKVYYESIHPKYVTDFEADSRGFLQWIRVDVPVTELSTLEIDASGVDKAQRSQMTYTEYWSKTYFAVWVHALGANAPLNTLGDPQDMGFTMELGIDFVPFVHVKFKDTGKKYGKSCVEHAIDKIDEANREATRLTQMLFRYNKPLWGVLSNAVGADGSPLPPPKMEVGGAEDATFTDNSIVYLPGKTDLKSLIPAIDYDAALKILDSMMDEIEKDLPELKYYSLQEKDLSGKAIALLLGGAMDRNTEARGNFTQGMVRANQIALTMGRAIGLFPENIGMYRSGDYDHTIFVDSAFSDSLDERANTLKTLTESGVPVQFAMKQCGFSEAEIMEAFAESLVEPQ
jgi:hypothetical protein